jgi:hypothetical protein
MYTKPAVEYLDRTEAFDRTVCTGPIINGEIRPANGVEVVLINRNAKHILKEVSIKHNIRVSDLMDMIRNEERHYMYPSCNKPTEGN